jgi:PAS domain S-box-containing protein
MEERVPAMIENEYTFQDGRKNWYEVNVYPVPDGILCISSDISSRKKAELALRQSEKVMRYIIRHDPNALAVYDETLRYIAVSDRYLEDYNVKERDILGKHHYEVFPEMPQRWKDVHQRVLKGTIERNDDDWFERQDGSITHNRWECRPWYRENGTIGGMITYTEVTTRRKKMEASLRESEERFREMAGLLPEAVFELDENLRVTYVNNSALELSGYSREEFDQGINVLDLFDSRDHDRIMDNFRKRITEKIDDPGGFEYTALRRDGATFPVRIHATSIVKNGELCGLRGVAIDITEFKRKEKELLAKEKYLEGIFNGIGMAVFVLDVEDGRYLFSEVNSKYREILDRFGMGDFQGRYLDELTDELPERVREAASQKYGECVSRNETLEYEEMGPPLGGQETWWLTRLRPLTDDDGNVFRIIGSTIEITERKSMEMEMRFKSMLLDQIQDLITATDLEGTIQYVNSAEARMFGVPREELIGKTIFDYGEDEEKGATQKDILETTLDNGSWRGEIVNYSFDGREYILDCRTWKILNEEGEAVALCSVSTDITEQREKDRSLRENRKKLRTIIDEAPIGIFYYNTDGVITECNDVFVSIIGSSRNVLIGMNMPERLKDQKLIKAVQTSLQEGSAYYEDLYESVTADKKTYVRILFKGIRDEDEVITAGVALIEDITERKKAEAKLQEAYRQKESLFRELQHRTMNTFNLLNNMIILKVLSAEAKEARLALEDIAVRIQSLSELYSLLHDSDAHGNISLKDYIPRLVSSISTLSGSIKLVTEVDNVHVSFKNATTLGLIVTELATNSTKHAFPDGRSGHVSISIKRHDDNITIEVRDNGVGLPDGFDPVQTESMGLRLVKDMVDQLQGTLEYDHNGGCEWKITVRGVDAKQDE